MSILILGGSNDQEVISFLNFAYQYQDISKDDFDIITVLLEDEYSPSITWDYEKDILLINQKIINIKAIWIRQDIFHVKPSLQIRAQRWHHLLQGWIMSHPDVKVINRNWLNKFNNKPYQLFTAQKIGLQIPKTVISNSLEVMEAFNNNSIIKPIDNGYCKELTDIINNLKNTNNGIRKNQNNVLVAPCPAFLQNKLETPEYRIYSIFGDLVCFKLESKLLDHRTDQNVNITHIDQNIFKTDTLIKINKLCGILDLDFAAIDLKTDTETENEIFLEINDFPMHSRFDLESFGKVSFTILKHLMPKN